MANLDSNQTSALCEIADMINRTPGLRVIQILQCVFGLLAIPTNVLALYLLCRVRVFHSNLRLLLANFSLVLALYPAAIALKAFRFLLADPCDLPILLRTCVMQEWSILFPFHNSMFSLVTICMERVYATLFYRTYDYAKAPPYLASVLLLCAWAGTLFMHFRIFPDIPRNVSIPICESGIFVGPKQVMPGLIIFACFEAASFSITSFVYVYNRFILNRMVINRAKFNLSARFQVDQNLKLSSALLPSDLLHVVSYLPSYVFLIFTMFNPTLQLSTRMWLLHLTLLYRMIYASAHPVLLITRNPTMSQAARRTVLGRVLSRYFALSKCFGCCRDNQKIDDLGLTAVNVTHVYFNQLEKSWWDAMEKRQRRPVSRENGERNGKGEYSQSAC